ncbi:MAG: hypothetical protein R2751_08850 [Bacteroidales bacterium]
MVLSPAWNEFLDTTCSPPDLVLPIGLPPVDFRPEEGKLISTVPTSGLKIPVRDLPPSFLWEIRAHESGRTIRTWARNNRGFCPLWLRLPSGTRDMEMHLEPGREEILLLDFPLGGLLVYLLSTRIPGLLVHGSGVMLNGRGFLFLGRSGAGKSTMAHLWVRCGAEIIHDDRLLLRKEGNQWIAHSTPVLPGDRPVCHPVHHIGLLRQDSISAALPVKGTAAFESILEHCIQHQYDREVLEMQITEIENLAKDIPVHAVSFPKKTDIVGYLLAYHGYPA